MRKAGRTRCCFIAQGLINMGRRRHERRAAVVPGTQHMVAAVRGDAGHLFAAIQQGDPFAAEARAVTQSLGQSTASC
jgi:prephenate dehydrogenase